MHGFLSIVIMFYNKSFIYLQVNNPLYFDCQIYLRNKITYDWAGGRGCSLSKAGNKHTFLYPFGPGTQFFPPPQAQQEPKTPSLGSQLTLTLRRPQQSLTFFSCSGKTSLPRSQRTVPAVMYLHLFLHRKPYPDSLEAKNSLCPEPAL